MVLNSWIEDRQNKTDREFFSMKVPVFSMGTEAAAFNKLVELTQGTYNVNYTLIDISQQAPNNISLTFTFQLDVFT